MSTASRSSASAICTMPGTTPPYWRFTAAKGSRCRPRAVSGATLRMRAIAQARSIAASLCRRRACRRSHSAHAAGVIALSRGFGNGVVNAGELFGGEVDVGRGEVLYRLPSFAGISTATARFIGVNAAEGERSQCKFVSGSPAMLIGLQRTLAESGINTGKIERGSGRAMILPILSSRANLIRFAEYRYDGAIVWLPRKRAVFRELGYLT